MTSCSHTLQELPFARMWLTGRASSTKELFVKVHAARNVALAKVAADAVPPTSAMSTPVATKLTCDTLKRYIATTDAFPMDKQPP
jgi:hypothetical protein